MISFFDYELQHYISEDIPYFDLTTSLQENTTQQASLEIYTREDIIVACTEEAARIAQLLGCTVEYMVKSKQKAKKDEVLLRYVGEYANIHQAYRLTQILLEYSCKIATQAHSMKELIKEVNPKCELLTTRKTFPFSKKFCIKAALCGGAMPHRLGLSESILFFDAHRILYPSNEAFYNYIGQLTQTISEKKIVVEAHDLNDAKMLMQYGVHVIQLDKLSVDDIYKIVTYKNQHFEHVKILVAGGVNRSNVQEYAKTNIDGVVTSSVYLSGMADLGSRLQLIK